ncbi:DUF3488 and DUF4129 domain-containing transglutaminase family protein [Shewanella algae]|uniref:transglutaminase TgpA family protein n=1 Tax=Shewanella algae TaxID=38313 RepID=UPI0031F4B14A
MKAARLKAALKETSEEIITRRTLLWLLITNLAVLAPLAGKITLGTLGICAICFVWRLGIYLGKVARPPRVLVTVLAIAAALTLALVSRELGLLNALVNLLILGYSLKYIEMRSRRDVKAVVLVGYFLIALTFIDHQQMLDTLQLSLVAALNTCVLASLYHEQASFNRQIKLTLVLLAQSLPLALLLFVVLPRFSPLWMVPQMKSSTTGLSDELSFGDISRLTKSNELAFRASFKGQIPAPEDRYWRALVLEEYDGKRWQQSRGIKALQQDSFIMNRRPEPGAPKGPFIDYSIIAEPSGQHWLFGLDLAYSIDPRLVNLPDFRLYAIRPVEQRLQYRVMSYPDAPLDNRLRAPLRQLNLSLPDEINPRSRKLAADFARRYPQAEQRLTAMMQYFNSQPFFYTLTPPPVGPQQLDDFLFENRAGFCVHYASAFTFMARATGLPARIVTGYQGGEYNPQAGYLSVYQYMAHAWSEVYLEGKGWVRYDPTAMIAPERIEQGFDSLFSPEESYLSELPFAGVRTSDWYNSLRLRLASLDYYWSVWVLGFDNARQQEVLSKLLGEVSIGRLAALVLGVMALTFIVILFTTGLLRLKRGPDSINRHYLKVCRQAARLGLPRPASLGPVDYAAALAARWPALTEEIESWTSLYIQLKYQDASKESAIYKRRFIRQSRALWFKLLKQDLQPDKSST